MNNILVLYHSNTGQTAAMAHLVAEGAKRISHCEVRLRSLEEVQADELEWCDGLALGSPTNMGLVSWQVKRFWDIDMAPLWQKLDGKIGCVFSSSGGLGGGGEIACQSLLTILLNFGFLVFGVTDYVGKARTLHYGATVVGAPASEDAMESCRLLGQRLAEWVSVHKTGTSDEHPVRKRSVT